jgi:hypothetical protein
MANYFDRFDEPEKKTNYFDRFDEKQTESVLARAHREGVESMDTAAKGATNYEMTGPFDISGPIKAAGSLLSGMSFPFSYPTGAAASLLGSGTSAALEGTGHLINKLGGNVTVPSQDEIYQKVRPEMDTALMGMGARGAVPVPTTKQVGSIAKQQYDDVLARAKYVPVSDPEFASISQRGTASLNNAGMRAGEYPFTHGSVADLANPTVNDLAEVVSVRRALNDPGKNLALDPKAQAALKKREGAAIGEGRKSLMADIESIDPVSAERLLAADKEYTVFNQAKDVDKFISSGKRATNYDVSGALRRNFGKIANDADKMKQFSAEEQHLIKGLAGGQYNILTLIGKLDPRKSSILSMIHGGFGYTTGGISTVVSGLGFAAQVLSNRMALSKANKLGELIRSKSSGMQKVTGPMAEWGKAALAFQADPAPKNFARLSLSSTNFSNNLASIGIDFSRLDLMKSITGPATGRAED